MNPTMERPSKAKPFSFFKTIQCAVLFHQITEHFTSRLLTCVTWPACNSPPGAKPKLTRCAIGDACRSIRTTDLHVIVLKHLQMSWIVLGHPFCGYVVHATYLRFQVSTHLGVDISFILEPCILSCPFNLPAPNWTAARKKQESCTVLPAYRIPVRELNSGTCFSLPRASASGLVAVCLGSRNFRSCMPPQLGQKGSNKTWQATGLHTGSQLEVLYAAEPCSKHLPWKSGPN